MTRVLITAVLALAALLMWQDARHSRQNAAHAVSRAESIATQLDAAKAAQRAYERNAATERAVLTKRVAQASALAAKANARTKELEDALKSNASWADSPIPDSVFDAISNPVRAGAPEHSSASDSGLPGTGAKRTHKWRTSPQPTGPGLKPPEL